MAKLLLLIFAWLFAAEPALVAAPPVWVSDPAQAAHLAPVVTIGGFRFQPPKGYKGQALPGSKHTTFLWFGPGDSPTMVIGQVTLPPEEQAKTLAQLRSGSLLHLHTRGYTSLHVSPTETGTIHGVLFERLHWTGIGKVEGHAEGFLYLGQQGAILLNIDVVSGGERRQRQTKALAVVEASILTLQPK